MLIKLENIKSYILLLRQEKIMLDFHLAELYDVETRALKQAVKRNTDRFPEDFMFELSDSEIDLLVSQNVIPSKSKLGGAKPLAFTEQGVAMLSSVLRSKKAVEVNIAIMRAFVQLRRLMEENHELKQQMNVLEAKYDEQFKLIFEAIRQLLRDENIPRQAIGFKAKSSNE